MKEKNIILAARFLCVVVTPLSLSLVGSTLLFTFSYLSQMPWGYKLSVLAMVYFFTILMPTMLIKLYRNYHGWTLIQLSRKERRVVPYLLSIVSYYACFYVMRLYNIPHFMGNILMAALVIQIVCALINVWWKISTHTAAIGGVVGALLAFSFIFMFNPITWLCFSLVLSGLVGASRIILRQHTFSQVTAGYGVGVLIAFVIILGL